MNKIMDTGQVIFIHQKKNIVNWKLCWLTYKINLKAISEVLQIWSSTNFKQVVSGSLILNVRQGGS